MFADFIVENDRKSGSTIRSFDTQRFAVSPAIIKLGCDLMEHYGEKIQAELTGTVMPAEQTWLEFKFAYYEYGVLLIGKRSKMDEDDAPLIRACFVVPYVHDIKSGEVKPIAPFEFDFAGDEYRTTGNETEAETAHQRIAITWAAVLFNIIGEPKIATMRPSRLDKLNKARARRGKAPYLEYREVFITPEAKGAAVGPTVSTGSTKKLHHVRTFIRIRLGKLEIVRPHWRGDGSKGIIIQRHSIKQKGEKFKT